VGRWAGGHAGRLRRPVKQCPNVGLGPFLQKGRRSQVQPGTGCRNAPRMSPRMSPRMFPRMFPRMSPRVDRSGAGIGGARGPGQRTRASRRTGRRASQVSLNLRDAFSRLSARRARTLTEEKRSRGCEEEVSVWPRPERAMDSSGARGGARDGARDGESRFYFRAEKVAGRLGRSETNVGSRLSSAIELCNGALQWSSAMELGNGARQRSSTTRVSGGLESLVALSLQQPC
jgi:hypothetical protein